MIDGLKTAAAALCGSLIVTAVFMMLVPSAGQERVLRLAVSLFFLLSLAAPLVREIPRWQEDLSLWESSGEAAADFQSLTESRLLQVFEQQLERQARDLLEEEGITPLRLHFTIHIDGHQRISITSLELLLDRKDADRCGDAVARLNEMFGLTAVLSFAEDGEGEG